MEKEEVIRVITMMLIIVVSMLLGLANIDNFIN